VIVSVCDRFRSELEATSSSTDSFENGDILVKYLLELERFGCFLVMTLPFNLMFSKGENCEVDDVIVDSGNVIVNGIDFGNLIFIGFTFRSVDVDVAIGSVEVVVAFGFVVVVDNFRLRFDVVSVDDDVGFDFAEVDVVDNFRLRFDVISVDVDVGFNVVDVDVGLRFDVVFVVDFGSVDVDVGFGSVDVDVDVDVGFGSVDVDNVVTFVVSDVGVASSVIALYDVDIRFGIRVRRVIFRVGEGIRSGSSISVDIVVFGNTWHTTTQSLSSAAVLVLPSRSAPTLADALIVYATQNKMFDLSAFSKRYYSRLNFRVASLDGPQL
jgi:hypothetical protein